MYRILSLSENKEWDEIVKSFPNHDIYYMSGYASLFQLHGDGKAYLFYYENGDISAIYVYLKRDTFVDNVFDCFTPYGYGGILFNGTPNKQWIESFWNTFSEAMKSNSIISDFMRYHPILKNHLTLSDYTTQSVLGKTVAITLDSPEIILSNLKSECRNRIRKARSLGVTVNHERGLESLKIFSKLYYQTMDRLNASQYYYFSEEFFTSIEDKLQNNYEIFYACYEGKILSAALMIFANNQMHYFLGGSISDHKNIPSTNLLFYEASLWGFEKGFKTLHLGGGYGFKEDSLYRFKLSFNTKSNYLYTVGKHIFDQVEYDKLVKMRIDQDKDFDINSPYFPLYRG